MHSSLTAHGNKSRMMDRLSWRNWFSITLISLLNFYKFKAVARGGATGACAPPFSKQQKKNISFVE